MRNTLLAMRLSIAAAAREAPGALALISGGRAFGYGELAREVSHVRPPAVLAPEIDLAGARGILAALEARTPLRLSHPARPALPTPVDAPGAALLLETSGSTAAPRLARLSRRAVAAHCAASAARLGWRPDDRWLVPLPLCHAGGLSCLLRCLWARRAAVLLPRFSPAAFADAARRHRATLTSVVPAMLAALIDDGWRPPPSLRAVLVGGAAAPASLVAAARRRGVPLVLAYGMTETFSHVALDGVPLDGVKVRVTADGAVEVRGPMLFSGYAGDPERDSEAWHRTGDRGRLEDGLLRIEGRADDVINSGGEKVAPAAVERALGEVGLAEVCVFGLDDPRWGQLVCAAIAAPDPVDLAEIDRRLASRLARFERPRRYLVEAALPRLPSGKIDRRGVAAMARDAVLRSPR